MRDELEDLMGAAAGRADYADVRHVATNSERISTRNGAVNEVERSESEGAGVRVRSGGAWGFAATRDTTRAGLDKALQRALDVAAAAPRAPKTRLAPEPPARGSWASKAEIDPFSVPLEEKLTLLLAADASMRTGDPRIVVTTAHMRAIKEARTFASTEGALCEQLTTETGGGILALAASEDETQVRSHPTSHDGDVMQSGWEHFAALDLAAAGPRVAEEAVALLAAPACRPQRTTIVLGGQQLALQVHESVGHAVELDRVLGTEASYAGTSFVRVEDVGRLRFGSGLMNVTADATVAGGLGSYGWDDEGVQARTEPIVREGTLAGFLTSRESAAAIGLDQSGGCMRADGFARQPIVRMSNVNLEPGDAGTLADLIAATESGLYLESNRSWSIDSRRLHFQFATEAAWEIVDGQLGRLVRNPSYSGTTPEFWRSMDAICSPSEWRLWGLLNCGKGEPGQSMRVSHGTAPARFRDVQVGLA
jgi:TldD protein